MLIKPTEKLETEMSQKLSNILTFTKNNNNIKNIAKTAAQIFKLDDFAFCSEDHKKRLELLCAQLMMRVFCRDINRSVRTARKTVKNF